MKPSVEGILETALHVDDLDRSVDFYKKIFGFDTLFQSKRGCGLAVAGSQVFLLFQKGLSAQPVTTDEGVIPGHDGSGRLHMAFSITRSSVDEWRSWLEANGVEIESTVNWHLGGTSLYFRDPDDHVIELATPGTWTIY